MKSLRVLIADDEKELRESISATLDHMGFETVLACDGEEAAQKIRDEDFAIAILDVNMPIMDGVEALRRLREWGSMPVIVLSARTEEQLKVKALDLGADDYLTKPFSVIELLARVRAARSVRRWRPRRLPMATPC